MHNTKRVVLASGNAGKLKEFAELLAGQGLEVIAQGEFNVTDADETGLSFIENAILKARHAAHHTGLPAIADDSGIEVDALKGAPGIYSARFSRMHGGEAGDAHNNALLLKKLSGIDDQNRSARFRCVIAFMRHAQDPSPIIAQGSWEGRILHAEEGAGGFGYDPLFQANDTDRATALLDKAEKNRLSHRGKALQILLQALAQPGVWLNPKTSED